MNSLFPFIPLLLALPAGTGGQEDPQMPFTEHLDQQQLVTLQWGFNDVQGIITFRLSIRTTGWVGFGFSPNGGMSGSDIVIGGIGPDGKYFSDRHATGNTLPLVDEQQSYTLLSLTEDDGQTIMTFQRSIQSCDGEDFHITASPVKLIYAYGTTDNITYHGHGNRRGTKEVNLLKYMPRASLPHTDYMDVRVDNITIPPIHTYYHCKVMTLPRLNRKHHIYLIEPAIENIDIVHHMLLYSCPAFVNETYNGPCYTGDKGDTCFRVTAAWGVGGGDYELPENAGLPIGGEDSDMFYRLEIHYNNPTSEAGRRDSSGMRLYYTDQLRQHDTGIMMTGLLVDPRLGYEIPPSAASFHTYGTCNTSLFSELVDGPVPDLHVFSVGLHTHLAGRKMRAGIFRNGNQVDFLSLDENYNFEMQQVTNEGNIKTIKPGDEILVECTYSTINRTEVTKMGFATTDEMCLAFVFYYPAIAVHNCVSHPNMENLAAMLEKNNQNTSLDLDAIPAYEESLKSIPQTQWASDNSDYAEYTNGIVRSMMKTPVVSCRNAPDTPDTSLNNLAPSKAPRGLSASWVITSAGGLILLLL